MKKIQSAVIAICIIFFAAMSHAQEMRLFNAKAGISYLINSGSESLRRGQSEALALNVGFSATYNYFELELNYVNPFLVLGRRSYKSNGQYLFHL